MKGDVGKDKKGQMKNFLEVKKKEGLKLIRPMLKKLSSSKRRMS
jgi:hypothetical protein